MSLSRQELKVLLLKASASNFGILVSTNNPDKLRQKLYPVKKDSSDFAQLSFVISPTKPEAELLIIKKAET